MPKQYHYVVCFDEDSNSWNIDFDISLNHDNGNIWDTKTEEWSYPHEEDKFREDIIIQDLSIKLGEDNA